MTQNAMQLLRKYGPEVAVYAIMTGSLGASTLQPATADRYLRELVQRTVVVNEARRLPMTSNTRNIDRLTHSGRVMVFPGEGNSPALAGAVGFQQRQLIAGTMLAAEDWSRETIEDNLEGDNLEDTIIDVMSQLNARDLEELCLYANADDNTAPAFPDAEKGGDSWRENLGGSAHDGWLLLSDHLIDKQGAQPNLATDIFAELMDAIPTKILDSMPRADWRFYVNSSLERRYREELGERSTPLGDRALFENMAVSYQGIPIVPVPMLRLETRDMVGGATDDITDVTDCMLVYPSNLVVGFQRQVNVDVEYKPRTAMFELTINSRGDANVEDPDSYATMINVRLPGGA